MDEIKNCENSYKKVLVVIPSLDPDEKLIEVVEKVCDKICIISKGKLQGVYKLEDLRNQNISLEQLYIKQYNLTEELFREDCIFFDIETTGFSPVSSCIYCNNDTLATKNISTLFNQIRIINSR